MGEEVANKSRAQGKEGGDGVDKQRKVLSHKTWIYTRIYISVILLYCYIVWPVLNSKIFEMSGKLTNLPSLVAQFKRRRSHCQDKLPQLNLSVPQIYLSIQWNILISIYCYKVKPSVPQNILMWSQPHWNIWFQPHWKISLSIYWEKFYRCDREIFADLAFLRISLLSLSPLLRILCCQFLLFWEFLCCRCHLFLDLLLPKSPFLGSFAADLTLGKKVFQQVARTAPLWRESERDMKEIYIYII